MAHVIKLKYDGNLLQYFNPRKRRYCCNLPWYFYEISPRRQFYKTFWNKYTHSFGKLDHFYIGHYFPSAQKWSCLPNRSEEIYP